MRKRHLFLGIALIGALFSVGLIGCDSGGDDDDNGENFSATYEVALSGANEVPPVATSASGQAVIEVNRSGTEVTYSISAAGIENVTQAHIHLGGAAENGGVVAFLLDARDSPISAGESTEIASGTLTEADLIGSLEGASFMELVDALANGNAYVNVHTEAHPPGEIRGQINSDEDPSSTVFTVTVANKTGEHPNSDRGFGEGYVIDGEQGRELTLERGQTYVFQMEDVSSIHPFYISTSEVGAGADPFADGVSGNGVTGDGTLVFTPDENTPDLLYYQCQVHQYMGWRINIVDAEGGGS